MSLHGDDLNLTFKLPESRGCALMLPFAKPTGYDLGKSCWITASFGPKDFIPLPLLFDWMDESFCAVAPKKVRRLIET